VIILRSIVFNVAFYLNVTVFSLIAAPALVLPSRATVAVAKAWGRASLRLTRLICGLKVEWRGLDALPPGPLLIAAKHQSAWETFALLTVFDIPTFVLKRELLRIPFFGWSLWKGGMIPVDRGSGKEELAKLIADTRAALAEGRQIIVFPEGTRRPPGAEPDYKLGLVQLYAACNVPCVPVALNSGLFWPRRSFLRLPGTIRVEFLDPIPPGLPRAAFFRRVQQDIEAASARLAAEGRRELAAAGYAVAAEAPHSGSL
jgi:1-acyl-sn-glycerol-3-phosphate acyltransferase